MLSGVTQLVAGKSGSLALAFGSSARQRALDGIAPCALAFPISIFLFWRGELQIWVEYTALEEVARQAPNCRPGACRRGFTVPLGQACGAGFLRQRPACGCHTGNVSAQKGE